MKFKLFQIHLTRDEANTVNELGWAGAMKAIPKVKSYMDKERPDAVREAWTRGHYEHVADIEATDLENAFHVGNVGPEENITRFSRMHSVSVGDVVVDPNGVRHLVAGIGFEVV